MVDLVDASGLLAGVLMDVMCRVNLELVWPTVGAGIDWGDIIWRPVDAVTSPMD